MKHVILTVLICLFVPISLLAAEFHDAMGRKVVLTDTPERIVSLVPAVTEILFKLEQQHRLVATTSYCDFPEAAKKLPKIGEYINPGIENILLFQPDLVIASADMNSPSLVKRLEDLSIPVYVVYPHTVEETLETIRAIGALTSQQDGAEAVVLAIKDRVSLINTKLSNERKPRVLACIMLDPLTVAGPDTFIDDVIRLAGGRNIVTSGPSRYPTWSRESLLSTNPDVIIVSSHPGQPDAETFFNRWPQLKAIKQKNIIKIDADWLHRPGPRMILGINTMAQKLHPNVDFDD